MSLTPQEKIEYHYLLEMENYDESERHLNRFFRSAWDVLEPGTKYLHNWHIDLICEYLEAIKEGQIKRLIINIPFRYGKSLLVSISFPAWMWIHRPESRWFFTSYAQDLATDLSLKRRRLINSQWYQWRWGEKVRIVTDQNVKTWFENDKTGSMTATGAGGSITGRGGNFLVVDDPLKTEDAMSGLKRKAINDWFDQTFYTRLNDRKQDSIIIIMHRLHQEDLTGHLLQKRLEDEYQYQLLSLPLIAEKKTIIEFPISKRQIIREEGDILFPAKDNIAEIADKKESLGSQGFHAQCQQNPRVPGGNMVKREWWQYYKELPNYTMKYQSWDTAIKKGEENAYTVCITMVTTNTGYYITDVWRKKVEAPELKKATQQLYDRESPNVVIVEDKASGQGLIQEILRETKIPIKGIQVEADKISRLNAQIPTIEVGKVYLPENIPWVIDFIDEFAEAPVGKYWDQIDAFTQLLAYIKARQNQGQVSVDTDLYSSRDLMKMAGID
ncbi:MAG: phage terminase large subunit [bacterium]